MAATDVHNLGSRLARGAAWMILLKFAERGLGLVSTMILARLLVPADFGIIAMATSVVFLLELLNAFGFEIVLVQKKDVRDVHYNTAWTFRLLFAATAAALLVVSAVPAAGFYGEPRLVPIILILAAGTLIQGFHNIGTVEFMKELQFRKEFIMKVAVKIIAFSITIPLAFYLRSYWALLAGMVSSRVAIVILSYVMHRYRPRFTVAAWREIFGFSVWLFIGNVFFFLRLRSADFILGKLTGASQLGLFSVAYEIAELPTTELVSPINRAAFPAYSKVAHDRQQLRKHYLDVNGLVGLLVFPAGLGVAAVAELLIPVFLGQKWLGAIDLIKILALNGALVAIRVNIGSVFLALGRPKLNAILSGTYVAFVIPTLIYASSEYGAIGAAWSYLIVSLLVAPLNFILMTRLLDLGLGAFLANIWRPLISSALMYYAVWSFVGYVGMSGDLITNVWNLGAAVAIGAAIYAAVDLLLWWVSGRPDGAEQRVIDTVMPRLASFSGSR